ncbi:MAG: hypothetical protein Q8Q56_05450 [Alphaproteobacteria bacterium]|nr:hypothetical protein [Alphaproteobacteria bacterium]
MYKTFIARLSLGLLLLTPFTLNASSTIEEVPSVLSSGHYLTSTLVSDSTSEAITNFNLFRTQSTLSEMSKKERNKLAKKLESSRRIELESTIPEERQDVAPSKSSGCLLFWTSCFRVSSKTLGGLAIDIVLDLSDGKLDGKGPNGSIDYIKHVAEIIDATMEEIAAEKK